VTSLVSGITLMKARTMTTDTDIIIKRESLGSHERYVTHVDGYEAVLTFTDIAGNKRVTDHTGVPRALGGRGIGTRLVERAVEDARRDGKTIIPSCWFVRQQIERNVDWQDVVS